MPTGYCRDHAGYVYKLDINVDPVVIHLDSSSDGDYDEDSDDDSDENTKVSILTNPQRKLL